MPILLKNKNLKSPGIISFTHSEFLYGVINKSHKVRDFLEKTAEKGEWVYGIHIQGDCSHLAHWPLKKWQSFIMLPNTKDKFISNVPKEFIFPYNCVNFIPSSEFNFTKNKDWDLCIISRPSEIKRITETLLLVRKILDKKAGVRVIFIVTDPRKNAQGSKTYKKNSIDENFFTMPKKIFSSNEMSAIDFICTSQESFGNFPLTDIFVNQILNRSKFLLCLSLSEGGPRVIPESFMVGTPCIVPKNFRSGVNKYLNNKNTLFVDEDLDLAASQICNALRKKDSFQTNVRMSRNLFSEKANIPRLHTFLKKIFKQKKFILEGDFMLHNLANRLACHGQKNNFQIMNSEKLFFKWIERAENFNTKIDLFSEEDYFFPNGVFIDNENFINFIKLLKIRIKILVYKLIKRIL
jgi:hypothetical protein